MATFRFSRRSFIAATGGSLALTSTTTLRADVPSLRVARLRVDNIESPLGLENLQPRLSWQLESPARNVKQRSYRILVASSEALLRNNQGDLWDSGEVTSRQSIDIPYAGSALSSRQKCWWCVQVWDESGNSSGLSEVSTWEMGLLNPEDWQAQWLAVEDSVARADREAGAEWIWGATDKDAVPRKFRLEFDLPAAATNVTLALGAKDFVTGAWIDGEPVALDPRPRYFGGAISVTPYELKPLRAGRHVIAVEAGIALTSVLTSPAKGMVALLRAELANGETVRVSSGPSWKTSLTQEARWFGPGYDDRSWQQARAVQGKLDSVLPSLPAMYLRKQVALEKSLRSARLYTTGLCFYEARINGQRVSRALLTSEESQFDKRVLYLCHDVTSLLRSGDNVIGLVAADGWFAADMPVVGRYAWAPPPRRVLAQLELTFADGSTRVVTTGEGWRIATSSIVESDVYHGEVHDERLEQAGWDSAGFDDSKWERAELAERPSCSLTAQVSPPIREIQTLAPRTITNPKPGVWVVDFGQNFAGWCRLRVAGDSGRRIELQFAETLLASGEVDQSNLYGAKQRDVFILKGGATTVLEPRFTYHGFRYVQLSGLTQPPDAKSIEGVVVHTDLEFTGQLQLSQPLMQQLWSNALWSQRSNFVGIPTDCPQRRERIAWTGDMGVFWDTAAFNMDVAAFSRRQLQSFADAQLENGAYLQASPNPYHQWMKLKAVPAWSDAAVIMAWTTWQRYGDTAAIEENWDGMYRYVRFILEHNPDHLWKRELNNIGDHVSVDAGYEGRVTTPHELFATAYWAHSVGMLAQMAEATKRTQEAQFLRQLHASIRAAFIATFVTPDGHVGNRSQTSYVLALRFGLLPEALRKKAAAHLVADIERRGKALSTGFMGTQFLIDVLTDAGYAKLAYDLILRTEYPSWGYMIQQGATTIWETWNGRIWSGVKGESMPNSFNHYSLGAVVGFFYRRVAGIEPASPGFEKILIRPVPDARLGRVRGDYLSIMGRIVTRWEQTLDGRFQLDVTIPANTTAEVHLPASLNGRITESRRDIFEHKDLRVLQRSKHATIVAIGSGSYSFAVEQAGPPT